MDLDKNGTVGTMPATAPTGSMRSALSKVPEVTVSCWIIEVLCTTVGEPFADLVNGKRKIADDADPGTRSGLGLGLGTTVTSIVFLAAILAVVLSMTNQQCRHPALATDD